VQAGDNSGENRSHFHQPGVGNIVGMEVFTGVGRTVGCDVPTGVGKAVGVAVDTGVGKTVGCEVATGLGNTVGSEVMTTPNGNRHTKTSNYGCELGTKKEHEL